MRNFSFWKPDPIPGLSREITTATLEPFGKPTYVVSQLLTIPGTINFKVMDGIRVIWTLRASDSVGDVVWMSIEEDLTIAPGMVLVIRAASSVRDHIFHRLYVQIFERFSSVLLDEKSGSFLTPREFRKQL
jgi:hypothetical protein